MASIPRIYQNIALKANTEITLDANATLHLINVLRLKPGEIFIIFNGKGGEYKAIITAQGKRECKAKLTEYLEGIPESPCLITLGQAISRGERMDYAIQKSVELGVFAIQPLITEHVAIKLTPEIIKKRLSHWQGIAISAAEQSGGTVVPTIYPPLTFEQWLDTCDASLKLILNPYASETLPSAIQRPSSIALTVGPEGGLSTDEIALAKNKGFLGVRLGHRILRTETAAVSGLSLLQYLWGDWR